MGLFFKADPIKKLRKKHRSLLDEAYRLSQTNRARSEQKMVEADRLSQQIIKLSELKSD